MTIIYSDGAGLVKEDLGWHDIGCQSIDFVGGYVYFTGGEIDEDGNYVERKIPVSAMVQITY